MESIVKFNLYLRIIYLLYFNIRIIYVSFRLFVSFFIYLIFIFLYIKNNDIIYFCLYICISFLFREEIGIKF